jgi:hypothetical protein
MTIRELDSLVAKQEGKRHQASIGDVREIRRILFTILWHFHTSGADEAMLVDFILRGAGRSRKAK